MPKKTILIILGIAVFGFLALKVNKFSTPSSGHTISSTQTKVSKSKSHQLIAFTDFWSQVQSRAQQIFPNQTVYLAGIKSDFAIKQPQANGQTESWQAHLAVCDEIKDVRDNDADKFEKICHGKAKYIVMDYKGVKVEDDLSFYDHVISFADLKITPQKAEQLANRAKNYQPTGQEIYLYDLTIGRWHNTPVWKITKKCAVLGSDKPCGDSWVVKVNAVTGEIVE